MAFRSSLMRVSRCQLASGRLFQAPALRSQQAVFARGFASPAKVNMELIKKLRVRANAGIMECKNALTEVAQNPEVNGEDEAAVLRAAVDILRQRGIAKASSKSDRVANEGLVSLFLEGSEVEGFGTRGTLVELNCETDFVSNTDGYRALASEVNQFSHGLIAPGQQIDSEAFSALQVPESFKDVAGKPFKEFVSEKVIEFGENLTLRRAGSIDVDPSKGAILASYVHNRVDVEKKYPTSLGRTIGVVGVEAPALSAEALQELAKALAIHVVAAESRYLSRDLVPESEVAHEKDIITKQLAEAGEDKFVDKKIEGRMRKFYEEICLLEQPMVSPEFGAKAPSVESYLVQKAGKDARITGFLRYEVGAQ